MISTFSEGEGQSLKRPAAIFITILSGLAVVIALSFIVSIAKTLQGGYDVQPKPSLSVTGEGKIFVKPNVARFTATVVTDAARVGDAQNQNSVRSNAVVDFLKKNGVEVKDIKTINYSVEPQYQYENQPCLPGIPEYRIPCITKGGAPQIVSYRVRSAVEVKVRDLNKIDDLLQGVVTAGANEVGSIMFSVDDEKSVLADARKKAIEDAQAKATMLARDLGVRIKKIVGFSEYGGGQIYYARTLEAKGGMGGDARPAPDVQPGEQEVTSTVTITYEFR